LYGQPITARVYLSSFVLVLLLVVDCPARTKDDDEDEGE
jgi:hypothetical protein